MSIGSAFQMVGGIVGGPWGMVIAIAGSAIDYAMSDAQQVGKIDDKNMLITSYGQPIQKFWGASRVSGVAIWCTELEENRERSKGKGGGGGKQDIYTYKGNLAIAINDNPVTAYLDIIKDQKELIYTSNKKASKNSLIASQDFAEAIRFYHADINQRPDPLIQSIEGYGKTPAYRDLSYFVIDGFETKTPYAPSFEVVATTSSEKSYVHHNIWNYTKETAYDNNSLNVVNIDYNRYAVYQMSNDNLTLNQYFIDSSGARQITSSNKFDTVYFNDLGQQINFLGFRIARCTKGGSPYFIGTSNSGSYIFRAVNEPFNLNKKTQASNLMTIDKFGIFHIYYEDSAVPKLNGQDFGYQLRDWDNSVNYTYASVYNKIIRFTNVNDIETIYHNENSSSGTNGSVGMISVISDDLIYFTEKSGANNFLLRKIENGVISTVRNIDNVSSVANYMYSENGESILFVHNFETYGGGQNRAIYFNTPTYENSNVKLSDIVLDIIKFARKGDDEFIEDVDVTDIDVSELETIKVHGFTIKSQTTAREALEQLAQCYFFEVKQSGNKLVFFLRGKKPITTIYEKDLISKNGSSGDSSNDFVSTERKHDNDLYNEIRVNFIDKTADYKVNSQYVRRQSTNSVNSKTFDINVSMGPDEARTIATKILDSFWKCRTEYKFKLSIKHSFLEPGDVINLNLFGNIHIIRITKLHSQDGSIEVTAISEDPGIYNQKSVGASIDKTLDSEVSLSPATNFQFLDIPYLRDQDAQVKGVYIASGSFNETKKWRGCSLLKSLDLGSSFNGMKDFTKKATLGTTLNVLGNFSQSALIDNINFVTVKTNGSEDLLSVDFSSILNGANFALVGDEIIQFTYAQAIDNNTYNLYGLLRGCKGTEYATSTHKIDERFVLLTPDTLNYLSLSSADFDIEAQYKAVSFGSFASKTVSSNFTYVGQAFECYSPVQISGGFHTNGATLNWTRRARLNHSWNNFVDVPLDESSEIYQVEIIKNGSVIRTLTSNTTTIEYPNSQILEDFTVKPNAINFVVSQVGTLRGYGNKGYGTIH